MITDTITRTGSARPWSAALLFLPLLITASCSVSDETFDDLHYAQEQRAENEIRFEMYMGKNAATREGHVGTMDDATMKDNTSSGGHGFGIFAYYTGANTYEGKNGAAATLAPNFMYNQHIRWDSGTMKWVYGDGSPKYWPNEVQKGAVDDQDNDSGLNPATSSGTNGGNLSFFAYSPYVSITPTTGTVTATTDGIIGFTSNSTLGDPMVSYKMNSDGKVVDLLWGVYGATTGNVVGGTNAGTASNGIYGKFKPTGTFDNIDPSADNYNVNIPYLYPQKRDNYQSDILRYSSAVEAGYTLTTDLTKQKTDGKVGFTFKHALAKVGGATTGGSGVTNGMMIILDLDKDGAETGGEKDAMTIVTVENITVTTKATKYDTDGDGDFSDETAQYYTGGIFNLATGKWGNLTVGTAITHIIGTKKTETDGAPTPNPVLNHVIAEPDHTGNKAALSMDYRGWHTTVDGTDYTYDNGWKFGVQAQKAQNVYEREAMPLVFIPGTVPSFNITITYYVRTYDASLSPAVASDGEGTWSKVKQVISKDVTFTEPVELNKQYSLLIHLGLTSVKFTASVSNWDTYDTGSDSDGDGELDLIVEDAHLPINVAEYSVTATLSASSMAAGGGTITVSSPKVKWYDINAAPPAWQEDATSDVTYSEDTDFTSFAGNVVTFSANESTKNRTANITVHYTGGDYTGKTVKDLVVPIVQSAGAVTASPATTDSYTASGGTVAVTLKDAATNDIDLTNVSNAVSITSTVEDSDGTAATVAKTSTGVSISVPKNESSTKTPTYTIKVKVNDSAEVTITINQDATT